MFGSDIYQFAKKQHKCTLILIKTSIICYIDTHMLLLTWITSENCSASIVFTHIENQLIFDDNIIYIYLIKTIGIDKAVNCYNECYFYS
jgi:hypothetical protein